MENPLVLFSPTIEETSYRLERYDEEATDHDSRNAYMILISGVQ